MYRFLMLLSAAVLSGGCSLQQAQTQNVPPAVTQQETDTQVQETFTEETEQPAEIPITITIGTETFSAVFYDNESARAVAEQLPLTIEMQELNSNEKYYRFSESFPTAEVSPDTIQTGDIMLYGSDYLVLFYETHRTSYRYTPIGKITDPTVLREAVGTGDVTISWQKES